MEEILSKLHDLFAALRKDSKQYIEIVEPKLTHPNNDYERMFLRKALGFEKDRSAALKGLRKQLSSWLNQDSFTVPDPQDQLKLYADTQLEQYKLHLFLRQVEDTSTLSDDGQSKKIFSAILEKSEQFEKEFTTYLIELEQELMDKWPSEASTPQALNHSDKRRLSVGSLIEQ
ncbi:hypothetical protein [Alkalicoccobacillus porphyridii]|uniref:Uncharacterized protein n=1 Tax=Alkalicoccobacillus porphyridii TaxID=2597270 RepID=A0A553ZVQ3_9BACI|nr:hypothetical protein [Alkalicoccobacillus porphyridii]TSB45512.1 hypothetical protein FN960_16415 [Alkalicoccobacillus porphyridii]